jgi:hypothetical protein
MDGSTIGAVAAPAANGDGGDVEAWRLNEAREFLRQRGIVPENGAFTIPQLAAELVRRGWRWELKEGRARAEKAYTPTGTEPVDPMEFGSDPVALLTLVLNQAIHLDEMYNLSPISPYRADIVVRSQDGSPVALVEAKNLTALTPSLAAEFRSNLVGGAALHIPFFLLASQDTGFLWKRALPQDWPVAQFPMRPVVAHYLPTVEADARLSGSSLAFVLSEWLSDLARRSPDRPKEAEEPLVDAGFLGAIGGASVHLDDSL